MFNPPKAYLFTFVPYGTRLHGDSRGSVDSRHNVFGTEFVPPDLQYEALRRAELAELPLLIDGPLRGVLDDSLVQHCDIRGWHLHAHNIRTNHVHAVIEAAKAPAAMLTDLKAYLTRGLRRAGLLGDRDRVWAEGGSSRYLFTDESVARACEYVLLAQGPDLPRA